VGISRVASLAEHAPGNAVLGGVCRLRCREFGGRRPYRFLAPRHAVSGRWEMWMDEAQAEAVRAAPRG
jgi:hypothetical protein